MTEVTPVFYFTQLSSDSPGHVIALRTETDPVTDFHPHLRPLCQTLELILRKGIKGEYQESGFFLLFLFLQFYFSLSHDDWHSLLGNASLLGLTKRDYWHWIESLLCIRNVNSRVNPALEIILQAVKKCQKVISAQGRGRIFLRLALQKKVLPVPIEILAKNPLLAENCYDTRVSILGNEILTEILLSLLFEITEIKFRLNTKCVSFLDETWDIPVYKELELVPCSDLGIEVHHMDGRVVVASVDKDGVASEDVSSYQWDPMFLVFLAHSWLYSVSWAKCVQHLICVLSRATHYSFRIKLSLEMFWTRFLDNLWEILSKAKWVTLSIWKMMFVLKMLFQLLLE